MTATPDVRCDRHVGETYPPRCFACQELATEYAELGIEAEL